jgi:hypothetical protein
MTARLTVTAILAAGLLLTGCGGPPAACGNPATDAKAADCAAWLIFVQINQRAAAGSPFSQWEKWATSKDVFNPKGPVWPEEGVQEKRLETLRQLGDARILSRPRFEVRLNRPTFDFIQRKGYWNEAGLLEIYKNGVDFPETSIEVKAAWTDAASVPENERSLYHWQTSAVTHAPVKLTGFHMTSKIIPNWLWATWIHESNNYPIRDRFGYPDGKRSTELEKLLRYYNLPPEWGHYRLVGTQTDFVTSTGVPVKLGNPEIEGGNAPHSSCMTCHAMARVDDRAIIFRGGKCCWINQTHQIGPPHGNAFENMTQLDLVWSFMEITNGASIDRCTKDYLQQCPTDR